MQRAHLGETSLFFLRGPSAVRLTFRGGRQIKHAQVNCPGKPRVVFSVTLIQNVFAEH